MNIYGLLILLVLVAITLTAVLLARRLQLQASKVTLHTNTMLHRDSQALYLRLRMALPQYLIFARTSLDVFIQAKGSSRYGVSAQQAELAAHTADFLICNSDFRIVAAVDLDELAKNRTASGNSNRLLRKAAIPVLHWTAANLPTVRDIQEAIAELETTHLLEVSLHATPACSDMMNFRDLSSRRERRS